METSRMLKFRPARLPTRGLVFKYFIRNQPKFWGDDENVYGIWSPLFSVSQDI